MDDYVSIIENYVQTAWGEGKQTPDIKAELIAKRWPEEMVEAVIDRLVKQRVEAEQGKLANLQGPDLWTQPTWPQQATGWSQPEKLESKTPTIGKPVQKYPTLPTRPKKRKFSELITANSKNRATTDFATVEHTPEQPIPDVKPEPAPVTPPATLQTTPEPDLPPALPAHNQPASTSTAYTDQRALSGGRTRESIVAQLKSHDQGGQKFAAAIQQSNKSRQTDEKLQLRSLIFLGILFFIVILALIWKFFVIQ